MFDFLFPQAIRQLIISICIKDFNHKLSRMMNIYYVGNATATTYLATKVWWNDELFCFVTILMLSHII